MRFCSPLAVLLLVSSAATAPAPIAIDYPEPGSIFPPEIAAPTFLFRDPSGTASHWRIDISFADGSAAIHTTTPGARQRIGPIDPECVAETNELPRLTPLQAAQRTWIPGRALWESIKKHSAGGLATISIGGFTAAEGGLPVSRGRVAIATSLDPAGAPIFYRDVPLMPSETEKGVIKPLAAAALPLVAWRLRNLAEPQSRVVMENVPMCANCHSFSADGRTLGIDLDGPQNNKGMYALAPVTPDTSIRDENVIQWSSGKGRLKGALRVGFMSQVSPRGDYVVTTIDEPPAAHPGSASNYYVANFKQYGFLQVFYPTRGLLAWYSRTTGILQPLPGADDPRFVQTNAVWSPDQKYLVFARAAAADPDPPGVPRARFANDPNERQIRYDLYRIPFNGGQGGAPEAVLGASNNGMSNSFPKVSPDGRWIVFVQARNGLLMRPDSRLFIVPAAGGEARPMRSNTPRMNSWHSFSPNGRWLVFSSKSRSPYTQLYLTHIDAAGNDSPAILVENTTASNRAANIPEFVNVPPGGLRSIGGPAIEYYRLLNSALYLRKSGRYRESAEKWRSVLELRPDDAAAHDNLGMVLLLAGSREEAAAHIRKAKELRLRSALESNPSSAEAHQSLGTLLAEAGRAEEAVEQLRQAVELAPASAAPRAELGRALARAGHPAEAAAELRRALAADSAYAPAHYWLGVIVAGRGETAEAITHWRRALEIDPDYAEARESLAEALYARGQAAAALSEWRAAVRLQPNRQKALEGAAWILATSPDPALRDGSEAVALAVRAVQLAGDKDAGALDVLAAAYAEKGRFVDAALTARRALALPAPREPARARALEDRIALYEAGKPFREPPPEVR